MALIKCTECGKEISDKATVCPNCGYPSDSGNNRNQGESKLIIYGYKETYFINVDIKVYKDNEFIGKIGNNSIMEIDIEKDCTIKFKAMFKTAQYKAKVNKGLQKILLSWDRTWGTLKVNEINDIFK